MTPPIPIRITSLRRQLAAAILTVDAIAAHGPNEFSERDASTLDDLDKQLDLFNDPDFLKRVNAKQRKLERHKQWRKRRVDNALKRQQQTDERRKRLEADLERWQQQIHAQDNVAKKTTSQDKQKPAISRVRELERVLDLLLQLRNARRKRLEAQGHLLPETGDDFYEQIKIQEEQQPLRKQPPPDEQPSARELYIHPEDSWHGYPLDRTAYAYWCQANQDIDTLRRIRNHWDAYLEADGDEQQGATKVPPRWVDPAPPSSWVWATCLDH